MSKFLDIVLNRNCNLNCKYCCQLAPSYKNNPDLYDIETYEKDIKLLKDKNLIYDFYTFLGGEILLVKNLLDYLTIFRKYYPTQDCCIFTNGLYLRKIFKNNIDFFKKLKELNIYIKYSAYPHIDLSIIDEIKRFGVRCANFELILSMIKKASVCNYGSGKVFTHPFISEQAKYDKNVNFQTCCENKNCSTKNFIYNCLDKSIIHLCCGSVSLKSIIEKFNLNISCDSYIDLKDLNSERMCISEPFNICSYCTMNTKDIVADKWSKYTNSEEIKKIDYVLI